MLGYISGLPALPVCFGRAAADVGADAQFTQNAFHAQPRPPRESMRP